MKAYTFITNLVCTKKISFEVENGILKNVSFHSGCPGSLQALSRLVEGRPVEQVIEMLRGIRCGGRETSCPDQLAKALCEVHAKEAVVPKCIPGL
ncbi:MAG: TIGR03905 family TSCPD domain-containing protein [Clostridia bacterium]|nr:TIGR03905 family TSCPD domain-containing protein [Clostridia bacterium]